MQDTSASSDGNLDTGGSPQPSGRLSPKRNPLESGTQCDHRLRGPGGRHRGSEEGKPRSGKPQHRGRPPRQASDAWSPRHGRATPSQVPRCCARGLQTVRHAHRPDRCPLAASRSTCRQAAGEPAMVCDLPRARARPAGEHGDGSRAPGTTLRRRIRRARIQREYLESRPPDHRLIQLQSGRSNASASDGPHVPRRYGMTGRQPESVSSTTRHASMTPSRRAKRLASPRSASPSNRS